MAPCSQIVGYIASLENREVKTDTAKVIQIKNIIVHPKRKLGTS